MSVFLGTRRADELAQELHGTLDAVKGLREAARTDPRRAEDRLRLRAWQAERLAASYPDLLASDRHGPAAQFFLTDLYGAKDFSQRDEEVTRILPTMRRMLPDAALKAFGAAIELDYLSELLDYDVVRRLRAEQPAGPLEVTPERYAAAYRACGHEAERRRQIELVDGIGRALDRLTRMPLVAGALELMRGPAKVAGLAEVHDFFKRGYDAFRHMRGADEFLAAIRDRETRLMQRLLAGSPAPFERPL
jgi:hypothetical protein